MRVGGLLPEDEDQRIGLGVLMTRKKCKGQAS